MEVIYIKLTCWVSVSWVSSRMVLERNIKKNCFIGQEFQYHSYHVGTSWRGVSCFLSPSPHNAFVSTKFIHRGLFHFMKQMKLSKHHRNTAPNIPRMFLYSALGSSRAPCVLRVLLIRLSCPALLDAGAAISFNFSVSVCSLRCAGKNGLNHLQIGNVLRQVWSSLSEAYTLEIFLFGDQLVLLKMTDENSDASRFLKGYSQGIGTFQVLLPK